MQHSLGYFCERTDTSFEALNIFPTGREKNHLELGLNLGSLAPHVTTLTTEHGNKSLAGICWPPHNVLGSSEMAFQLTSICLMSLL